MFYLFHGDDSFSQRETLDRLVKRLGDPQMVSLNTTEIDGASATLRQLSAACRAVPFLAPVRLVLVNGFFKAKRGKSETAELEQLLADLPPFCRLVFLEDQPLQDRQRIVKLARSAENGYEKRFDKPSGGSLTRWIAGRAEARGGQIEGRAAQLLGDNVGSELALLENELEKLVLYAGERPITVDDIGLLSPYAAEANIFALVDAVGARQGERATDLLQRKLAEGVDPFYLFTMLVRQFRLLLQAAELREAGARAADVSQQIGVPLFVARKILRQSQHFSLEQLERIYSHLLEADVAVKSGRSDMLTTVVLLVAGLAT